jgi:hypothetical protein
LLRLDERSLDTRISALLALLALTQWPAKQGNRRDIISPIRQVRAECVLYFPFFCDNASGLCKVGKVRSGHGFIPETLLHVAYAVAVYKQV